MQEIVEITTKIETDYPELYRYLDETPLHVGIASGPVTSSDLEDYLLTLKNLLDEHIRLHNQLKNI